VSHSWVRGLFFRIYWIVEQDAIRIAQITEKNGGFWCREGESIPTVFKGIVKITPILANCNIGAGLRVVLRRDSKSAWGQFPLIWGDFG